MKRAYLSFWILTTLYALSLCASMLCNNLPVYVRYDGRSYWPVFRFYPESTFTGSDRQTRPAYKTLAKSPPFKENENNFMIFPPVPFGPNEIVPAESIDLPDIVTVIIKPRSLLGTVNVTPDFIITRAMNSAPLLGMATDQDARGSRLTQFIPVPGIIRQAVEDRFQNLQGNAVVMETSGSDGTSFELSLASYSPRKRPPRSVRITIRKIPNATLTSSMQVEFQKDLQPTWSHPPNWWIALGKDQTRLIESSVHRRFDGPVDPLQLVMDGVHYETDFVREQVAYPFRPVRAHPLGLDSSGRDVLVQILYGLRISMSFGLVLVIATMVIGIAMGAVQGYYGGAIDMIGQRLIEIWSALPFLYVMILLGSVYGRSFSLLLICYGIFNWIGISYYIRAEFLKLRKQPFVEAAKVMGLPPYIIIFRHILPNGLVPVITFFPFSLVGAIGSLAALDYLGFGLPPPTPSWGTLLAQGQEFRYAWWLVLYPSLALFTVILLGVFIGEGVRAAMDPRNESKLE